MAWTTPPTFVAGTTLTAAQLNILADNLRVLAGARTAYTPAWTQATSNPTLGNGTVTGDFRQVDKEVDFFIQLTIGSTTAIGTGTFIFALPVTARRAGWSAFGSVLDVSASTTIGIPIAAESTTGGTISLRCWPGTAGNPYQVVNQTNPVTWATGDVVTLSGRYEAA